MGKFLFEFKFQALQTLGLIIIGCTYLAQIAKYFTFDRQQYKAKVQKREERELHTSMMVQGTIDATKELLQRTKTSDFPVTTPNLDVTNDEEEERDNVDNLDSFVDVVHKRDMTRKLTVIPEGTEVRDSYDSMVKGVLKIESDDFSKQKTDD